MISLTPGANAALNALQLTVILELDGGVEPMALLLGDDGRARTVADVVTPSRPSLPWLQWLSWDGVSATDGQRLDVNLAAAPATVATVRIAALLPETAGTFGHRPPPVVRVEAASGGVQATFEVPALTAETSLILLDLYRRQETWKVRAVGQGYAGGRGALLIDHGLDPTSAPTSAPEPSRPPRTAAPAPTPAQGGVRYERADRTAQATPSGAPSAPAATPDPPQSIRYERVGRTPTPIAQTSSTAAPPPVPHSPAPASPSPFEARPLRQAPAVTGPQPLWDKIETPPSETQPARPVRWEIDSSDFTWCERIRDLLPSSDSLPDGVDKFALADQWAQRLATVRAAGFEYAWRDARDRRLDPSWVTVSSAVHDPNTGRIVAAGHLTHGNFGTSPAYDLGALNGSNGMSWPERGHTDGMFYPTECLYVGSSRTGVLVPVDSSTNIGSVDLDPLTGTVAVLESLGTVGCISVYDGDTGTRRRLTVLEQVAGNEVVRFSPDGRWLLVPRYDGAHLCEVATGRNLRLDLKACCWWPLADSMLLEVAEIDSRYVPRLFNLEANAFVHDFTDLTFPGETSAALLYVAQPEVSPDGTELLALAPLGVTPEHRAEHGVAGHLVRISLADGRGHLVRPATLDVSFPNERDVSEARWSGPHPYRTVSLGPALAQQLRPALREHEYLAPGRHSPEAADLLIKSLNRAIELFGQDQEMAHLSPEIIMSLLTLREDPDLWARHSEWFMGLAHTVLTMILDGRVAGVNRDGWMNFVAAAQAISNGNTQDLTPAAAAWIRQ